MLVNPPLDLGVPTPYAPLIHNLWAYGQRTLVLPVGPDEDDVVLRSSWTKVARHQNQPPLTSHQALAFQVDFRTCFGNTAPTFPVSFTVVGQPNQACILRMDLYLSHHRSWTFVNDHTTLTVQGARLLSFLPVPPLLEFAPDAP